MKITFFFFLIMLAASGLLAQKVNEATSHKTEIGGNSNLFYIDNDNPIKVWYFDFGSSHVKEGYEQITPKSIYSSQKGFGIIASGEVMSGRNRSKDPLIGDFISSKKPFYFVVNLPEGVYQVTLTLGGAKEGSSTTVKAESRRLMLENIETRKGAVVRKTIIVDVRTPRIDDNEQIRLKERELNYLNWDNKLTLEFNGEHPCVSAIEIKKADQLPVIFLAGNSTVTDQEYEPWASWGQMFPRFFKPEIVVANYAESGETLLAFKREKRLQKLLSKMKDGDYLFIEFAHNDQKPGGNHLDPFTTYRNELKYYINEARKKGGKPVLVTSMHRRRFDEVGKIINTLENYPEAMRQTALEESVPLIDLNAMSKHFYEAMGPENSKKAFVHYAANSYQGQDKPLADDTHFNPYGAYELARCIVESIRRNNPELSKYLIDNLPDFDPAHPDDENKFRWYESPLINFLKPYGN